jgi:hypothetical protein
MMRQSHWLGRGAAALLGMLLVATVASAHHGWSSYDETKPITAEGAIKTASWGNPHGTATVETEGRTWEVVLAPTSRMQSRGLTEAMIAPGTKVRVLGYAHKKVANEMRAERITVGDKTVELR